MVGKVFNEIVGQVDMKNTSKLNCGKICPFYMFYSETSVILMSSKEFKRIVKDMCIYIYIYSYIIV